MLQAPPARPGMSEHEVDTPALLIDLDAFEYNLDRMAQRLAGTGVALRAHAKTHKSPIIARLQMARGAVGQCVQKIGEAEVLAWGGVTDILVSNQAVGAGKLARLAALGRIAQVAICVDDARQIDALAEAAAQSGCRLTALVEVDAGMGRCGVAPGEPALALARQIANSRHLRFGGIQAYHGSAQHLRTPEKRRGAIGIAIERASDTVDLLKRNGLDCAIVGGGGTGTFEIELASGVYTELQAGSYCFMDADYARNHGGESDGFRHALFVLGTVMSQTRTGAAVTDVGHKAVAVDSGLPTVWQRPDISFTDASDEHGQLHWQSGDGVQLGDKLRLVPGHCDPTVDRYDWYVGVRNGRVECVWPVAARGAFY